MNIFLVSHTSMKSSFKVGSYHLAKNLSGHKDIKVYHIVTPITIFHIFSRNGRKRIKDYLFNKEPLEITPFFLFPIGKIKKIDFSKTLSSINSILFRCYLKYTIKSSVTTKNIVVIDQPFFIPYLETIKTESIFYRPTDIVSQMVGNYVIEYEDRLRGGIKGLICTSKPVYNFYSKMFDVDRRILLENGVSDHFFDIPQNLYLRKNVVYIGAFDYRFDFETVFYLGECCPDIFFDLYGPISLDLLNTLTIPPNVRFKGPVKFEDVPYLLNKYRIGLLPLNDNPSNQGRSPMKMYEYLAMGVFVLSKRTQELVSRDLDKVYLYESKYDALYLLKSIYVKPIYYDADILSEKKWSYISERLLSFINNA